MDLEGFTALVGQVPEAVRESLAAIEREARTRDEASLYVISRGYAQLLSPLREYLAGATGGRPLPRRLATRLEETVAALSPLEAEIATLGLHPDLPELRELARLAASVR